VSKAFEPLVFAAAALRSACRERIFSKSAARGVRWVLEDLMIFLPSDMIAVMSQVDAECFFLMLKWWSRM